MRCAVDAKYIYTPFLSCSEGVTLCGGQTYTLDAGAGWKSIVWKSNTGYTSAEQKIVVKDAGSYWLKY